MDLNWLTGGFLVLAGGALAARSIEVPKQLLLMLRRRLLLTLEMESTDEAFAQLWHWLAANARTRWLGVATVYPSRENGRSEPETLLFPRGFCWFKFRGRRVLAWITRETVQGHLSYRESITLQTLFGGKSLYQELLAEARRFFNGEGPRSIDVWIPDHGGCGWRVLDRKPARTPDSLCLADGMLDKLIDDVRAFREKKDWYREKGIPWRRGYLFYGAPGNGKSSIAHVIASEMRMSLCVLNLSNVPSDSALADLFSRMPGNSIVLLEDVDVAFSGRHRGEGQQLTFSGLLNVLDGATSKEGQIVVMSTNHFDSLDPALVRPGRADMKVHFGNASEDQARRMYRRFFSAPSAEEAFVAWASGKSMAEIQSALLSAGDDPWVLCVAGKKVA